MSSFLLRLLAALLVLRVGASLVAHPTHPGRLLMEEGEEQQQNGGVSTEQPDPNGSLDQPSVVEGEHNEYQENHDDQPSVVENEGSDNGGGSGEDDAEDITPIVKGLLPDAAFTCEGEASPITCTLNTNNMVKFLIKYKAKSMNASGGGQKKVMYDITLTSRPNSPDEVQNYHASYRIKVQKNADHANLKAKLKSALDMRPSATSFSFPYELAKAYPVDIGEIMASQEVKEIMDAIFGTPGTPTKGPKGIFREGFCKDAPKMWCKFALYSAGLEHFRIDLNVGRGSIELPFFTTRFKDSFAASKDTYIKFFREAISRERGTNEYGIPFGDLQAYLIGGLRRYCRTCDTVVARPEEKSLYKAFEVERKDKKGGKSPLKVNYAVFGLYLNLRSFQYAHFVLDSDKMQTEALLDLNAGSIEGNLKDEIALFMDRNEENQTPTKSMETLTMDGLRTRMAQVEKSCKQGVMSEVEEGKMFHITCKEMKVLQFAEVESADENVIKVEFLVNPGGTKAVVESGFALQKSSDIEQVEIVKKSVIAYLKSLDLRRM